MKIVHEKDYNYLGSLGGWHIFSRKVVKFDEELLLLPRAKMINNDGTTTYFDFQGSPLKLDGVITKIQESQSCLKCTE